LIMFVITITFQYYTQQQWIADHNTKIMDREIKFYAILMLQLFKNGETSLKRGD
jgi:hypothetical protein